MSKSSEQSKVTDSKKLRNCITEQLKWCNYQELQHVLDRESKEHHKVVFASTKSLINDSVGCWSEATIVRPRGNK